MYFKSNTYNVMDGEPHLGKITEHELVARAYEVEDWILEKIVENHFVETEYEISNPDGGGAMIETADYVDFDLVYDYISNVDEIDMNTLYVKADVTAPKDR